MSGLSHFHPTGESRMVDVSDKPATVRTARATGRVNMLPSTQALIRERRLAKGDVLEVARLAGIMAAKRTWELIPLCHNVTLAAVDVMFDCPDDHTVVIESHVRATGQTGVEMEALTTVSVAALTIYDMCKSVDRGMKVVEIRLEEKSGGRSGHFVRPSADSEGK